MSGEWSLSSPTPIRPGFYISFQTVGSPGAIGGRFGTVAMPIVADWGPIDQLITVRSADELTNTFGADPGTGAATTHLAREAMVGGASTIRVIRVADGTEAPSTVTLSDQTPTTPKTIVLTGKHKGTRGNTFKITVSENPLDASKNDLIIFEGNVRKEVFTHTKVDADGLVAAINDKDRGSQLVTAARGAGTGDFTTGLVAVSGVAMTGGLSGTAVVAADYTAALDIFEREGGFDVFCYDGVSDATINASLVQWTKDMNADGNYVMTVVGGPAAETATGSVTRTAAYGSEFVVSLGGGDHILTLADGTQSTRSSAKLAPRVAGMIAATPITSSITRGVVPGVKIKTPLTTREIESLIKGGVVSLAKRGEEVIIEDGLTSFIAYTDEKDETFSTISNVRVMQRMATELNGIFEKEFLGKVRNTEAARQAVKTRIEEYLVGLEAISVLVNGSTVAVDTRAVNSGHALHYSVVVQFAPELKKILVGVRAPAMA